MGPLRIQSMRLVLLLALILPLQSFAAAWSCGPPEIGSAAAHLHCAPESGAAHTGEAQSHHHCGTCCAAAVAALPFGWIAPPSLTPPIALPHILPPPKVALDRLDRPPRLVCR
jgi:hypothetical protein